MATKVSFYLLASESQQQRYLLACRIIEKAYLGQQFCYVYTDTAQQSQQLDHQLWTYRAGSFIPHQLFEDKPPDYQQTVLIGTPSAPKKWQKIIINLSSKTIDDLTHTERIIEIMDNNEAIKHAGRLRYRQYKQAGLTIMTHDMSKKS